VGGAGVVLAPPPVALAPAESFFSDTLVPVELPHAISRAKQLQIRIAFFMQNKMIKRLVLNIKNV
jgi:hypothetical protein